jgi:hypothetical protein
MTNTLRFSALALALAGFLAACGGSDEGIIVENKEPTPSGLAASATVSGATAADLVLNGAYATSNLSLNNVTKVNPIGEHETCRFRFSGLQQAGTDRMMDGDLRYLPGTNAMDTTFVSIATIEFRLVGTAGAVVDKPNNRVVFSNAVLTSTQGTGRTITLNATIPMRGNRPEGC